MDSRWLSIITVLVLAFFSLLVIYSVAPDKLYTQAAYYLIGFTAYLVVRRINPDWLASLAPLLFCLVAIQLVVTLVFGQTTRGSIRWLTIGGLNLQASEWAKPALILFSSLIMSVEKITWKRLGFFMAAFGVVFLAVFKQPDLGTSLLLGLIFLIIFFSSRLSFRIKILLVVVGLLAAPLGYSTLKPYQKERLINFTNPYADPSGSGYNVIQSVVAIGSGRLTGKGLGVGTQSHLNFLPERQTDFIFASLVEELGFLGGSLIIFGYAVICWRILVVYQRQDRLFFQMICLSVFGLFLAQVLVNIGMNMGILPVTGVPLPLLSVGGNSLVVSLLLLGIVECLPDKKPDSSLLIG
jgi:rod shape determining protein RodA